MLGRASGGGEAVGQAFRLGGPKEASLVQPRAGSSTMSGVEVEARLSGLPRCLTHLFVQAFNTLQQDLEASRAVLAWKYPSQAPGA